MVYAQLTTFRMNGIVLQTNHETFKTRFQEHMRLKHNRSTFAQDLLEKGHAIGKMEEIMIIHAKRTGRMLNILETFLIYKETKAKKHINDTDPKKKLNIPDNITTRPLRGIHSTTTEYPVK